MTKSLTDLPAELRLEILRHAIDATVLNEKFGLRLRFKKFRGIPFASDQVLIAQPAISKVCRSLRVEALEVFYSKCELQVNFEPIRVIRSIEAARLILTDDQLASRIRHIRIMDFATWRMPNDEGYCRQRRLTVSIDIPPTHRRRATVHFCRQNHLNLECRQFAGFDEQQNLIKPRVKKLVRAAWQKRTEGTLNGDDIMGMIEGIYEMNVVSAMKYVGVQV